MDIAELKQHLTILEVASHLGIRVDKHRKALCPFHDDKTPSLQFSKDKNIATCFSSSCNAGTMDIINLTEKYLKLNTHQAILKLKEWAGAEPGQTLSAPRQNTITISQNLIPSTTQAEELTKIALLTKAFAYYENALRSSPQAKKYLESRNLKPLNFKGEGTEAGYNSGTLHNGENKYLITSAIKHGLIKEAAPGRYTTFGNGCIVFPLRNSQRQITGLYFRETSDTKAVHHYYLKNNTGLYPSYPKAETKTIILTESIIDAATLLQLPEIKNQFTILACYGTNGFTKEHEAAITALKELHEIIIFFDADKGGKEGARKLAGQLHTLNPQLTLSIADCPEGEDINSLSISHDPQVLVHLLEKRNPFLFSTETTEKPSETLPAPKPTQPNITPPSNQFISTNPYKLIYITPQAEYSINGGLRKELDSMKVTLVIEHTKSKLKYRSKLDLYENKQIEKLAQEAGEKLNIRPDLIEINLSEFTDLLESYRDNTLLASSNKQSTIAPLLEKSTIEQCKTFLSKPNLINRFNELIGQSGVIGEENNRIFLFGIAASYKMPNTLHALIQGSSGSGKTHLLVKISSLIPNEDCKRFTRVTESSFYNYGMYDLSNKLICLEDLDGIKEEAFLAFRELQSRGMISSSTSGKDEQGNIRAFEKIVYGPIASLSATTKGEIYEDNMNRCFLIAVDETSEQTSKIISYQNRKSAGQIDTKREEQITEFIKNCIRLLKPYNVINPYADKVNLPPEAHKIRRLNDLYQNYVRQITLLNQYQRKQDPQGRLISQKEDLTIAAEIMFDSIVLKIDELDGSLRLFYERLKTYVKAKGGEHYQTYRFCQREIRQTLNISKTQLQRYLYDLLNLEYIQQNGGYANRGFTYKILYWDNITVLRAKVKRHLQGQLDQLELLHE